MKFNRSLISSVFQTCARRYRSITGKQFLHLPARDHLNFFKKCYFGEGLKFFKNLLGYAKRKYMEDWFCPLYLLSIWMPVFEDNLNVWVHTSPKNVFENIKFTRYPSRNVSTFQLNLNWIENFWHSTVCRASKYDN